MNELQDILSNPYIVSFVSNVAVEALKAGLSRFKEVFPDLLRKKSKEDSNIRNYLKDERLEEEFIEKISEVVSGYVGKRGTVEGLEKYLVAVKGDYIDMRGSYRPIGKVINYYDMRTNKEG